MVIMCKSIFDYIWANDHYIGVVATNWFCLDGDLGVFAIAYKPHKTSYPNTPLVKRQSAASALESKVSFFSFPKHYAGYLLLYSYHDTD